MKLSFAHRNLRSFDASSLIFSGEAKELGFADSTITKSFEVTILNLSHNYLQIATGLNALRFLVDLDLSHNQLASLMGLPMSIERLNVSHNLLCSLHGTESLPKLRYLDVSYNKLQCIDVHITPSVVSLYVSHNEITSVKGLGHCHQLLTLHFDHNCISHLDDVVVLAGLKALRNLTLAGNRVCENPKLLPLLCQAIPKLTTLDKMPLSQAQANKFTQLRQQRQAQQSRILAANQSQALRMERSSIHHDTPDDIELRAMEARVKELSKLVQEETERQRGLKQQGGQLAQQCKRTRVIIEEQEFGLEKLRAANEEMKDEAATLRRTVSALDSAFRSQHASIVYSRIGNASTI